MESTSPQPYPGSIDWHLVVSPSTCWQPGRLCQRLRLVSWRFGCSGPKRFMLTACPPPPYHWSSALASHCGNGHKAFVTRRLRVQGLADTRMKALDFPETKGAHLCEGGSTGTLETFPSAPELPSTGFWSLPLQTGQAPLPSSPQGRSLCLPALLPALSLCRHC